MHRFDLRHTIIPFSLLRVINIFKEMMRDESIEVEWSEPEASEDLLKVLPKDTVEVLWVEAMEGERDGYRMRLKKIR